MMATLSMRLYDWYTASVLRLFGSARGGQAAHRGLAAIVLRGEPRAGRDEGPADGVADGGHRGPLLARQVGVARVPIAVELFLDRAAAVSGGRTNVSCDSKPGLPFQCGHGAMSSFMIGNIGMKLRSRFEGVRWHPAQRSGSTSTFTSSLFPGTGVIA